MIGIADTGFLVAFANRRDEFFPWAHALAENIHEPLLTCEADLADLCLIRMSELNPSLPVISVDGDF